MHCSTGQGKTASLLFSAPLQNRLTACLCHCKYTYGDLHFIQVCSDATPMHCSTGQGKTASLLFSAPLQNRLTACLCHCNFTCGALLFIQVCSDATPKHCRNGQAKQLPCCSLLLCTTGSQHACATAITPMEICTSYRCAVMQHQCTAEMVRQNSFPAVQCSSAEQAHSMLVPLQIHLWRSALHTGVK